MSVDTICGVSCECGPFGEPLACGLKSGHAGPHAWASLPTFVSVERAHAKLGALLQTAVDHDSQATPDGFRDARKLGLIDGANPALTPAGRAALVLLGVWVPNG